MGSSRNHGNNIRAHGTGDWKYEDWSGNGNYEECLHCSLVELGNVVLKIVEFFQVAIMVIIKGGAAIIIIIDIWVIIIIIITH